MSLIAFYPFLHIISGLISTCLLVESKLGNLFLGKNYWASRIYDSKYGLIFFSLGNFCFGLTGVYELSYEEIILILSFALAYLLRVVFLLFNLNMKRYHQLKFFLHTMCGVLTTSMAVESKIVDLYCELDYCIADSFKEHEIPLLVISIINLLIGLMYIETSKNWELHTIAFVILLMLCRMVYFTVTEYDDEL